VAAGRECYQIPTTVAFEDVSVPASGSVNARMPTIAPYGIVGGTFSVRVSGSRPSPRSSGWTRTRRRRQSRA
jgi:hypothetical protein